ncbi:quaternary ammonium compound efflux SMR transporter SugE [Novipirellula rosea]|uniref:Guanidinium exporter n=1 Tax=Novipirellula rosea TaxID=1031540 RepID=A0ABP8MNI4_9BACT
MSWIFLVIAGLLEIGWAIGLKYTEGWSRVGPSVLTILTMIASFYCLAIAIKDIPIGTGYAIWTGIGAVGTAILGIILLGESASPMRIACIGVVILGIIGLKITAA